MLDLVLSVTLLLFFFFFSSRRRHTSYIGDWSSDVCSSDLFRGRSPLRKPVPARGRSPDPAFHARLQSGAAARQAGEIGRASCRERASLSVDGRAINNTSNANTHDDEVT